MRLSWTTDLCFEPFDDAAVAAFCHRAAAQSPDVLLVGGNCSPAPLTLRVLTQLTEALAAPVWFVLGAYDYADNDVELVRASVRTHCALDPRLVWLPAHGPISIAERTAVVGVDDACDTRLQHGDAGRLRMHLDAALATHDEVIVVGHAPRMQARTKDALEIASARHPHARLTLLCADENAAIVRPNLTVLPVRSDDGPPARVNTARARA